MLTALDAKLESLDDQEKHVVAQIREHGWFSHGIMADNAGPGFSYSTGIWHAAGFPEIIIFSSSKAHDILWTVFRDLKEKREIPLGERVPDILTKYDVVFLTVDRSYYRDYLGWSRWFYAGDEFPCVQMVWPDRNNRFPWQTGFEEQFTNRQPDLTRRSWAGLLCH